MNDLRHFFTVHLEKALIKFCNFQTTKRPLVQEIWFVEHCKTRGELL